MHTTLAGPLALACLVSMAACSDGESRQLTDAKRAEAQGRLATTPEQARLWAAASRTEGARGLEEIPVVANPVTSRRPVAVPDRKAADAGPQLAASIPTGVRILAAPELPTRGFSGAARVLRAEGERLELDLGDQRTLTLLVRTAGRPLRAAPEGLGRLDLRLSDDPRGGREIIAMRLDGDAILSVLETGPKPVAVEVPLFGLTARQVGEAKGNTMQVEIRVGSESKVLAQGETAEFPASRLAVGLVASPAYTGAAAASLEGPPFGMRLIAW